MPEKPLCRERAMFLSQRNFTLTAGVGLLFMGLTPCPADSTRPPAQTTRPLVKKGKAARKRNAQARPRFVPFGPPLPRERQRAADQATELRQLLRTGKLRFINAERDGQQLFCVARDGLYLWPPETPQAVASASYVPASGSVRPPVPLASRRGAANRSAPPPPLEIFTEKTPEAPLPAPPDAHLLTALRTLAAHSTPSCPLAVLSLFRPPYRTAYWRHGGPGTLHARGMAVDIAAYDGHTIAQSNPEGCVRMTLALLRDLPPGRYRLGLPKAPDTPLVVGRPFLSPPLYALVYPPTGASNRNAAPPTRREKATQAAHSNPLDGGDDFNHFNEAGRLRCARLSAALGIEAGCPPAVWPFFPAPQPEIMEGVIAGKIGMPPRIVRFKNEAYAPAEALAAPRLREAIRQAAKRGVVLVGLFPDGADHIHLDVRPKR